MSFSGISSTAQVLMSQGISFVLIGYIEKKASSNLFRTFSGHQADIGIKLRECTKCPVALWESYYMKVENHIADGNEQAYLLSRR